MVVNAQDSSSLQLWDCVTGVNTCPGLTIYCPNDYDTSTNEKIPNCILVSGDSGQFDAKIYSRLGFRTFLNGNSGETSLGTMNCGDNYEYNCPINNELDLCVDTIKEDPNDPNSNDIAFDTTCNNPFNEVDTTVAEITTTAAEITSTTSPYASTTDFTTTDTPETTSTTHEPVIQTTNEDDISTTSTIYSTTEEPTNRPTDRPTYKPTEEPTRKPTNEPNNVNSEIETTKADEEPVTTKNPKISNTMNGDTDNDVDYIFKTQEHELPIDIRNDDNKIYLGIDNELKEVTIEMKITDDNWIGIGFGSNYMNNTHAVIYAFDITKNEYTLTERILSTESPGFLLSTISQNEYIIKIINGIKTITYKRPFINKMEMAYHFDIKQNMQNDNTNIGIQSIIPSTNKAYKLPFIYGKGITKNFGYHYNFRTFNMIMLDIEMVKPGKETTLNPMLPTNNNGRSNWNGINDIVIKGKLYGLSVIITIVLSVIFCFIGLFIGFCWTEIVMFLNGDLYSSVNIDDNTKNDS